MHSKSDNKEIAINDEADEVIKKNKYQNNLESMKDSKFVFDYVQLLYYKRYKINPNCGESYINSPDWVKNKKATINPINKKDNKCFQYAITVVFKPWRNKKASPKNNKSQTFYK